MSQLGKEIWERRWEALKKRLDNIKVELNDPHLKSIFDGAVQDLKGFAQSHFYFFFNGFFKEGEVYSFEERKEYPPDYVLSTILGQISFDIDMIEKAARQRLGTDADVDFLATTDLLAQQALNPAIAKGVNLVDKDTKIITYFQKNYSIRIIPYAKVAFISIPYTCQGVEEDLLAIPHEVAHYVYRNGYLTLNGKKHKIHRYFEGQMVQSPQFMKNWVEEIFADTYGCLVAGPVIALDFQDLQLATTFEEFKKDWKDKEDPVPLLRPDIYSKVLKYVEKKLGKDPREEFWKKTTTILYDLWKKRRADKLDLLDDYPLKDIDFTISNNTIMLDEIMSVDPDNLDEEKELDKVIKNMLTQLNKAFPIEKTGLWSGDLSHINAENHKQLYENFKDFKRSLIKNQPQVPEKLNHYKPTHIVGEGNERIVLESWKLWAKNNKLIKEGDLNKGRIEKKEWVKIFLASGWLTRGPVDNPVGG